MGNRRVLTDGEYTVGITTTAPLRAAWDVLDLVPDLLEVIPEYCARERDELKSRADGLAEMIQKSLTFRRRVK